MAVNLDLRGINLIRRGRPLVNGVALGQNEIREVKRRKAVVGVDDDRAILHIVDDSGVLRPAEGFRCVEQIGILVAVVLHTEIRGVIRAGFLCSDGNGIRSWHHTRDGLHERGGISQHEAGV